MTCPSFGLSGLKSEQLRREWNMVRPERWWKDERISVTYFLSKLTTSHHPPNVYICPEKGNLLGKTSSKPKIEKKDEKDNPDDKFKLENLLKFWLNQDYLIFSGKLLSRRETYSAKLSKPWWGCQRLHQGSNLLLSESSSWVLMMKFES